MTDPEGLLEPLDEQQRAAATALTGPVCVLAGAGTGKTRAITHRIAYGVATGVYPPKRVMALTFTTRAASELRSRLTALGASGVAARTFHSAALAQLNYFWPQVLGASAPKVLDGKARLVTQAAEVLRFRLDRAGVRDAAAEIEFRKASALSSAEYAQRAAARPMPAGLDVDKMIALQELYETLKDERRLIDFEDVLLATAGMITSEPQVATEVHEQYRFFTVDEYQDVSPAQQLLLDAWLGERSDVCVVGDASQTIYSFAGARAEYLLRFGERRGGATVLRLEHNYRSVDGVVRTANALMNARPGALQLTAARRSSEPREPAVQLRVYASDPDEAAGVAADVAALVAAGTRPSHIAVLLRYNGQSALLEQALADAGVPVRTRGSLSFFEHPVIKQALMLLRGASVARLEEPLFKSVSDALRELGHTHHAPPGPGEQRTRWELLDALATLAEQAPAGTTLQAFVAELAERAAAQHDPPIEAITIATLHSAKGLEWPVVFVIGLADGLLPIGYANTPEQVEEERRLLYVGVTRAKDRLRLSWARSGGSRAGERSPSRFLPDLKLPDQGPGTSTARARAVRAG
ncbi:ATP-dependent helicase [Amnibacterium sp.]|uniref:ATP-dependent helicase n=1 Tax=Amnibacterium sp. TaxID=1872496 RepID=UPI002631243F|nr:ATP-dependent helicase [Amnibacterium sp.]MCU1474944.1 uvrD3 [Amnibacterium sp.]